MMRPTLASFYAPAGVKRHPGSGTAHNVHVSQPVSVCSAWPGLAPAEQKLGVGVGSSAGKVSPSVVRVPSKHRASTVSSVGK